MNFQQKVDQIHQKNRKNKNKEEPMDIEKMIQLYG